MNISARDIQAFLALAEVKNFTRAAARCHLSQPAFSALIKALEDHVGLKLFDRSTRHVLLTQEGERFWLSAQRIAEELEDCAKAMRDTAQLARGHVAVALLPSLAAGWLPGVLAQFLARHPGVEVAVQDVLSEPCITAVAQGEADFALAAIRADTPELQAEPFCRDGFHLVCRDDHPLAQQDAVTTTDLKNETMLLLGSGHCFRDHVLEVCPEFARYASNAEGIRRTFEGSSLETIKHMVAAGMGVTLVPRLSVPKEALESPRRRATDDPHIRYLPIHNEDGHEPPSRRVVLVWRRSFTRYEAIAALRNAVYACELSGAKLLT